MMKLYGISNCDTVKKARSWLAEHGLEHEFHDFKKHGVPPDRLSAWIQVLGPDKLLNRQGTTWRKLDALTQASASNESGILILMLENPSIIKRPVVQWDENNAQLTVGFNPASWSAIVSELKLVT